LPQQCENNVFSLFSGINRPASQRVEVWVACFLQAFVFPKIRVDGARRPRVCRCRQFKPRNHYFELNLLGWSPFAMSSRRIEGSACPFTSLIGL
jgi:hypothetical protein